MYNTQIWGFILFTTTVWQYASAGGYSHGGGGGIGGSGNANSFAHFSGPVAGPAQQVVVPSSGSGGFGGAAGAGAHGNSGGYGGASGHGGGVYGGAGGHGGGVYGGAGGHGGAGGYGGAGGNGGVSIDYVAYPSYNYGYGVTDFHTGDAHSQQESRDGDTVVGHYSLQEPGGNVRTVKYVADNNGFQAQVHNSAGNNHAGANQGGYNGHGGNSGKGW